ncbi:hypothetical protein D3C75_1262950 [compost metagenome]
MKSHQLGNVEQDPGSVFTRQRHVSKLAVFFRYAQSVEKDFYHTIGRKRYVRHVDTVAFGSSLCRCGYFVEHHKK